MFIFLSFSGDFKFVTNPNCTERILYRSLIALLGFFSPFSTFICVEISTVAGQNVFLGGDGGGGGDLAERNLGRSGDKKP